MEKKTNDGVNASPANIAGRTNRVHRTPPRGLRKIDAAAYIGISPTQLDTWIKRGIMPAPKRIGGVVIWCRFELDAAFDAFSDQGQSEDCGDWNVAV
jgi:predicted DNA-binding transcriptional regulator AlpA